MRIDQMPWFKFHPADWLIGTAGMSRSAKGLYIDCLCLQWHGKRLPVQFDRFARLFPGCSKEDFDEVSSHFAIVEADGVQWFRNERLYAEEEMARDRQQVGRIAAGYRWHGEGNADAVREQCTDDANAMLEQCGPNAIEEVRVRSRSKRRRDTLSWMSDAGWVGVSDADVATWTKVYGVDVEHEMAKAHQWLLSNPHKANRIRWRKFLTGWLSRAGQVVTKWPSGFRRDESHIPADCHPDDRRLWFMSDGRTPRTPLTYRRVDGTVAV
jgi:hypothetical protein